MLNIEKNKQENKKEREDKGKGSGTEQTGHRSSLQCK